MFFQLLPPSTDLYTPSPKPTLRWELFSPVPTQTTFGSDADTGSGDVRLHLGPDASFEARVDTGSGDIISRYEDVMWCLRHPEIFSSEISLELALGTHTANARTRRTGLIS